MAESLLPRANQRMKALFTTVVHKGRLEIVLENIGAGHKAPTGVSFLRDFWVDVEFELQDGSHQLVSRVLELGELPRMGEHVVPLLTAADLVEHRSLAPNERTQQSVPIPPNTQSWNRVLRTTSIRESVLIELGLSNTVRNDIVTLLQVQPNE